MVRYVSDDVGVMYLGQLVETCESEEIYKNPLHPYTKGLLSCIPVPTPRWPAAAKTPASPATCPARSTRPRAAASTPAAPTPSRLRRGSAPMCEAAPGHRVACHLYGG